jgi:hypothetical protein
MTRHSVPRRRFLQNTVLAAVAVPLLQFLPAGDARANPPRLPLTNAQAKALGYVEDAATVTARNFKPGSTCANCQFYTEGNEGCTIFPGFSVEPKGWCTAWAIKKA